MAAGFTSGGSEPGMAVRISELIAPSAVPDSRSLRVGDDEGLATWEATLGRGFGEGEKEARWVASVYRSSSTATRGGTTWDCSTVCRSRRPRSYLGAGVAGVYFVMTVPEARRRGIGAAITYAVLREAEAVAEYGVLGSSPAGRSVYARLGFREYCTIELYEWTPTG